MKCEYVDTMSGCQCGEDTEVFVDIPELGRFALCATQHGEIIDFFSESEDAAHAAGAVVLGVLNRFVRRVEARLNLDEEHGLFQKRPVEFDFFDDDTVGPYLLKWQPAGIALLIGKN